MRARSSLRSEVTASTSAAGAGCALGLAAFEWEDGGATYHTRYSTWEFFRGQEGDPWIGQIADPPVPPNLNKTRHRPKPRAINFLRLALYVFWIENNPSRMDPQVRRLVQTIGRIDAPRSTNQNSGLSHLHPLSGGLAIVF